MHSRDLVHCDLKLENVMLDQKTLEPRLIDFGICVKKGYSDDVRGTDTTMSPEAKNLRGIEPASDIYALGCIMYEQITGQSVITSEKINDEKMWENSSELKKCQQFIQSCVKEKPSERPTTQQILQAVRGEPIEPAKAGELGLREEKLHYLDILKPENGYALNAKHLLAENKKFLA